MALRLAASENFALAQHILDLVALCLGASRDAEGIASQRGLATARLDAIKADTLALITEPDLRIATMASRHHVSERYIQKLFEDSGATFTDFVREHRLMMAWRALRDPVNHWRKVSDIASSAGFSDISYFNRAFRVRFNKTPSDCRQDAISAT